MQDEAGSIYGKDESSVGQLDRFLDLKRRAADSADATALLAPERRALAYSELWSHICGIRRALRDAGLQRGEPLALVMRGAELITALLAISSESAAAPLNPFLTEEEYLFHLTRLRARFLIVQNHLAEPAVAAAKQLGICVLEAVSADDSAAGVFTLQTKSAVTLEPGRQTGAALLLHTSATTGNPKLIPLTAANLCAIVESNARAFELEASDRFLTMVPLFHSHGLGAALTQLFRGGSVICTRDFDAERFPRWIEDFHPTWISGGPPVLHAILMLAHRHTELFRRFPLRFIQSSGAPAHPELVMSLEQAIGAPVLQGYGMTEAVAITRNTLSARKPGSVGRSIASEVAITDEAGTTLPPGTEGEIVVRGPSLMSGYLDDPEANRAAFRNGWFRTGDLGHLDADGFLYITGRLKEIINRGGQKIIPSEVERVLATHAAVLDAGAFALPHATLGEDVGAAVVLRPGASVSEQELREFLVAHLAAFKVPRRIVFLETLPRGAAGKVQRRTLTEQFRELMQEPARDTRPPDPTEIRLIDIWRRILGVPRIGIEDDFFQLGGDSLSAAVMLIEVQRELNGGHELLDRTDFFEHPTIAFLSLLLWQASASLQASSPANRILPLQTCGSRVPFFCFAPDYLDPYYLRHLSKCLGPDQPFYVVCPPEPIREKRLLKVEELAQLLVSEIRAARPHGPYLLGGHCYGGVVSFEAAQQLLAQGERVSGLVLFDVPTPGYPKVIRSWKRYFAESRRMFSAMARGEARAQAAEAAQHVRRVVHIVKRRFGGRAVRAWGSVRSEPPAPQNPKELAALTLWEYAPREFPAPMVQFLAADEQVSTKVLADPRLGWRDFARAGLELRTSPGRHATMLDAENTPALAAQLEPLLQKLTAGPGWDADTASVHK